MPEMTVKGVAVIAAQPLSSPATAIELPASTNPTYPGCPWFAIPTGRYDAKGEPYYAFASRGVFLGWADNVNHQGKTLKLDPGIWPLGEVESDKNGPHANVRTPDADKASLPNWAKNGKLSILHADENGPFLKAMLTQLGPDIVNHLNDMRASQSSRHEGLPEGLHANGTYSNADISKVEVLYVANYGQTEGRSGNGRRITITYEVATALGPRMFRSDISDTFYTDPQKGGMYSFRGADGVSVGTWPVDHAQMMTDSDQRDLAKNMLRDYGYRMSIRPATAEGLKEVKSGFSLRP